MPGGIWLLLSTGALFALWTWATRARERVDLISREVCADLNLQRLDESVALRRIFVSRMNNGFAIRRVFSFEFSSNGADRRRADVCLLGAVPEWVHVDHPDGPIVIDIMKGGR